MEDGSALVQPRIHSAEKRSLESMVPVMTPISCHIDVSSLCNYRCSFCFQADVAGMKAVGLKRGFMDVEMFKRIVDQIQEFPDNWKLSGSLRNQYKQIGNAVPPLLANVLAKKIKTYI